MLAACSPSIRSYFETLNTLQYAARTKLIVCDPKLNMHGGEEILSEAEKAALEAAEAALDQTGDSSTLFSPTGTATSSGTAGASSSAFPPRGAAGAVGAPGYEGALAKCYLEKRTVVEEAPQREAELALFGAADVLQRQAAEGLLEVDADLLNAEQQDGDDGHGGDCHRANLRHQRKG